MPSLPPAPSAACRIASLSSAVVLFGVPRFRPPVSGEPFNLAISIFLYFGMSMRPKQGLYLFHQLEPHRIVLAILVVGVDVLHDFDDENATILTLSVGGPGS